MNKILVIGDIMIDHYVFGHINRHSPEVSNVPILDIENEHYSLGGAGNVAANIKCLNEDDDVQICGLVNHRIEDMLDAEEINGKDYTLFTPEPIIKQRFINSKAGLQLLRVDNLLTYEKHDIKDFEQEILQPLYETRFEDFDCIVVSDYCKGVVNEDLIDHLSRCSVPVFVDTKKNNLFSWGKLLENCIVKINLNEYKEAQNIHMIKNLIVTKGASGCSYCRDGNWRNFPTNPVDSPNVIGAGDSFLAGLVCEYLETKNIEQAIIFANKVAYTAIQKHGTSTVSRMEVLEFEDY